MKIHDNRIIIYVGEAGHGRQAKRESWVDAQNLASWGSETHVVNRLGVRGGDTKISVRKAGPAKAEQRAPGKALARLRQATLWLGTRLPRLRVERDIFGRFQARKPKFDVTVFVLPNFDLVLELLDDLRVHEVGILQRLKSPAFANSNVVGAP